ncbi:MAG TPA: DNA polymerase III subunit gamma/tau [Candidatus Sulfotelmatobacter sp.]|nr:DNA polymerase III subunit gamma/tau [Candidatus Sulfotelmatobacter sp.]
MVFYRKYRPQKIDELDNEVVRQSLYSIFSKGTFPHAFLFTGPKGLGKTSAARIIAKVINCEKHKNLKGIRSEKEIEPDNKCEQCVSITNGNNFDVLEIDGASNRGIDEIRDLREKIKLAPFKATKKVYIIDEVHMLTTEAFNALLKTLEEPPSHAVFILCTTESQKVPSTILSRCFRVNFTKATSDELVRSLSRIIKEEGIKIEKDALLDISRLADGSFRDAAKILEEVSIFAGRKNITKDLVNGKFNSLGVGENVSQMLEALFEKNSKNALGICRELTKQGMDFKFFIEELIERLHAMLLIEAGVEKGEKDVNFSLSDMKKLFEILSSAYQETKYAILPQIPLELAILEWTEKVNLLDSQSHLDDTSTIAEVKTLSQNKVAPAQDGLFEELISEVKNHNNLFAGVLRSCKLELKDSKLIIIASSKFHQEKIEETKNLKVLEDAAKKIFGEKISVKILLGGDLYE